VGVSERAQRVMRSRTRVCGAFDGALALDRCTGTRACENPEKLRKPASRAEQFVKFERSRPPGLRSCTVVPDPIYRYQSVQKSRKLRQTWLPARSTFRIFRHFNDEGVRAHRYRARRFASWVRTTVKLQLGQAHATGACKNPLEKGQTWLP
jgi:hypothetical protein